MPLSGAADLDAAVDAARAALPEWRAGQRDRARPASVRAARRPRARARRTWPAASRAEMGKTLVDARAEVARMIEMVEAACAIPTTMQGRILEDVARGVDAETIRQPVGVCAAIVPFNFPAMVPFWFLPFAIACGNTFVLKPSEQVPLTQQIAFEVLDGLGPAAGVVNLVNGGREVVEGILEPPGHRRGLVRRLGARRPDRLRARGEGRQARAGARRREEPHGRDARRRDRQDRRRPDRLGLRRRRPALHGRLGRRHGRGGARAAAAARCARPTRALRVGDGLDEGVDVGPVVSSEARDRITSCDRPRRGRRRRARASTAAARRRRRRRLVRRPDDHRRRRAVAWRSPRRRSSARS